MAGKGRSIRPSRRWVAALSVTGFLAPLASPAGASTEPRAGFTVEPANASLSVTFRAVNRGFPAAVVTYRWAFGDGTKSTTSKPKVVHTYQSFAAFHPSLTEKDGVGDTASTNGFLELFDCQTANPCAEEINNKDGVARLKASGPTDGQSPASLDLATAPYRIGTCEPSVGPDAALVDRKFTGNLTVALTYHPVASSNVKVTCFASTVAFLDAGGKMVTKGALPDCAVEGSSAPCVESIATSGSGSNFRATKVLLVPPGDPTVGAH